jgi:hypothetical protein
MPFAVPRAGGGQPKTIEELILQRENPIYASRHKAIATNLLAYHGGRPYVEARLTRFPAESAVSWGGSEDVPKETRYGRTVVATGRRQRAYVVNHCARIAEKIRQYVFQRPPEREGVDPQFERDANRQGQGLNNVMGHICNYITTCGWAWLGVDAPRITDEDGNPVRPTLAEQRAKKLRIYWNAYSAQQVPDWYIDESGDIQWLITEGTYADNSNPRAPARVMRMRRLWEPGQVTEYRYEVGTMDEVKDMMVVGPTPIGFSGVPFVLAGTPSPLPWWFDDVEAINRAIMDLESANDEGYFRAVYPQLVIPANLIHDMQGQTENGEDLARKVEMMIGYDSAIAERPEDSGITRWVMPPEGALGIVQKELERKREILFDAVGLQLKVQSRQVESAEAKAWSNLDAQAVLAERAQALQEAEEKAVAISAVWDRGFAVYQPSYARTFDISDINEDLKTLVGLSPVDMPDGMRRLHLKAIADGIAKLSNRKLTRDEQAALYAEIDGMDFSEPIVAPEPPAKMPMEDEMEDDDDDTEAPNK